MWEAVQEILDGRAQANVRADPHRFSFTGLIRCGHCGCALVAEIKKARYIYYHCSGYRRKCPERYVREEVLESRFVQVLWRLQCSDEEFDLVRRSFGLIEPAVSGEGPSGAFRKKGELAGAPGALVHDGIGMLDMARRAHSRLSAVATEEKQQMLGLIASHCSWANQQLAVALQRPFELLAERLTEIRRPDATNRSAPSVELLQTLFREPTPETRRLIARYNAMVAVRSGRTTAACEMQDNWAIEYEAA